jgi:hypothetical protein
VVSQAVNTKDSKIRAKESDRREPFTLERATGGRCKNERRGGVTGRQRQHTDEKGQQQKREKGFFKTRREWPGRIGRIVSFSRIGARACGDDLPASASATPRASRVATAFHSQGVLQPFLAVSSRRELSEWSRAFCWPTWVSIHRGYREPESITAGATKAVAQSATSEAVKNRKWHMAAAKRQAVQGESQGTN